MFVYNMSCVCTNIMYSCNAKYLEKSKSLYVRLNFSNGFSHSIHTSDMMTFSHTHTDSHTTVHISMSNVYTIFVHEPRVSSFSNKPNPFHKYKQINLPIILHQTIRTTLYSSIMRWHEHCYNINECALQRSIPKKNIVTPPVFSAIHSS